MSWADTYCPKKGEEFVFYPVTKVYKQILHGYDCFYDPVKTYKNGQTKAVAANRFKPNAQGLTPFTEIEGHTFVVTSTVKENAELSVDKQNFLCFLRREDGAELLLRIPFVRKTIDNTLTRGMAQVLTEKNSFRKGPAVCIINIPACPVDQLQTLTRQMEGQKLLRNKDREVDMTVSTLTQYLNGADITETLFHSDDVFCESVSFMEVKGYLYQQPIASANLRGRKIKLPVFDFRGDGQSVYGSYFSINTVFRAPAAQKVNSVLAEVDEITVVEEEIIYEQKVDEEKVIQEEKIEAEEQAAPRVAIRVGKLAEVSSGESKVEVTVAKPDVPEMIVATNVKMSQPSRVVAESAKIEEKPVKLDAPEKMEIKVAPQPVLVKSDPQPVVAMADPQPSEVKTMDPQPVVVEKADPQPTAEKTEKERLAELTKRFGAKNAALIAKGKVSKGFSKEMCKAALGEPDYINTTQNMFTTLEQWVYGVNLYLYFQKEKLQYIDEF